MSVYASVHMWAEFGEISCAAVRNTLTVGKADALLISSFSCTISDLLTFCSDVLSS